MRTFKNKKNNKGFTLIELMIAVSIIGILTAISLPAYQDYIVRTKIMEITRFSGAAKTYIWEEYFTKSQMPETTSQVATTAEQMILTSDLVETADYSRVDMNQSTLEVKLSTISGAGQDQTIIYTFIANAQNIEMDCTGGSLPNKYRSSVCRSTL